MPVSLYLSLHENVAASSVSSTEQLALNLKAQTICSPFHPTPWVRGSVNSGLWPVYFCWDSAALPALPPCKPCIFSR